MESPLLVAPDSDAASNDQLERYSYPLLCGFVLLMAAGYLAYSQTWAYYPDEGFHMLAAQLIRSGRLPYLDFFFPQTPLNAFLNAGLLGLFGNSWRTIHAVAATLAIGSVFLTADFVYRRYPVPAWRLACSLLAAVFLGANSQFIQYAALGQAYGLALFLSVSAFRLTVRAVGAKNLVAPVLAGLASSAAAAATLLVAPYVPVLFLWLVIYNRTGRLWEKATAYLLGATVPWLPMLWLFMQSPYVVRFNIFDYHARYRLLDWPNATRHDLRVLILWYDSSPSLLLALLAIVGLIYIFRSSGTTSSEGQASMDAAADLRAASYTPRTPLTRWRRAEFYLCAWLALAEAIHLSTAHPTFQQYFLFLIPPVTILAVVGLYVVGSRQGRPDRPWWAVAPTMLLMLFGTARLVAQQRGGMHWNDLEKVAAKVKEVTPPGSALLADEATYFLTKREPPEGLAHLDAFKLTLQPRVAKMLRLISRDDLKKQANNGAFATVQSCFNEIDPLGLEGLHLRYGHKANFNGCNVLWGLKPNPSAMSQ